MVLRFLFLEQGEVLTAPFLIDKMNSNTKESEEYKMEGEKKKSSLSTFLLFLAIVIIIALGCYIYKLYYEKTIAYEKIADLNSQIDSMKNNVDELQGTINNISNTINNSKNKTEDNKEYEEITEELEEKDVLYVTDAIKNDNNYILKGVIYTQYTITDKELKKALNDGFITINKEKYMISSGDSDNEYDLVKEDSDSVLYKVKKLKRNVYYLETQAQISDVWKLTNKYMEITLPIETKYSDDYEEHKTIDEVFKNYESTEPVDTTNPDGSKTFKFEFKKGKCVEVINVLTSV